MAGKKKPKQKQRTHDRRFFQVEMTIQIYIHVHNIVYKRESHNIVSVCSWLWAFGGIWCSPCCSTLAIRAAEETDRAHNGMQLFHCLHTFIVTQRFLWTTTEKHTGGNLTQILLNYWVSIVSQQFNDCQQMIILCRGDSGGKSSLP